MITHEQASRLIAVVRAQAQNSSSACRFAGPPRARVQHFRRGTKQPQCKRRATPGRSRMLSVNQRTEQNCFV